MYSVNAETTPNPRAWEDGKRLAEATLKQYTGKHGEYPRKVSYTFWAGEFITTEGATLAQVFWMLGVEPVRDGQGRVVDLRLVPSEELGRPRINVVVQVSGQLRDIAGSRLKLLTDAVRVASGTVLQEKLLVEKGTSPKRAREMSVMRVFGPVNSGYSTGIMGYTEHSGSWEDEKEIARLRKERPGVNEKEMAEKLSAGLPTVHDILDALVSPGRDPRADLPQPLTRSSITDISEIKEGTIMKGTVRNITDFGAFIDLGLHHDGLLHVSQMGEHRVNHPSDVLAVGDILKVKIIQVDEKRNRISLSLKGVKQ